MLLMASTCPIVVWGLWWLRPRAQARCRLQALWSQLLGTTSVAGGRSSCPMFKLRAPCCSHHFYIPHSRTCACHSHPFAHTSLVQGTQELHASHPHSFFLWKGLHSVHTLHTGALATPHRPSTSAVPRPSVWRPE